MWVLVTVGVYHLTGYFCKKKQEGLSLQQTSRASSLLAQSWKIPELVSELFASPIARLSKRSCM